MGLLSFKPESENNNGCLQTLVGISLNLQPKVTELDNELTSQKPDPSAPLQERKMTALNARGVSKGDILTIAIGFVHNRTPKLSGGRTITFAGI